MSSQELITYGLAMNYILKKLILTLEVILVLPVSSSLFLTSQEVVMQDVQCWVERLDWVDMKTEFTLVCFSKLFAEMPEFRNLYYYRMLQGGIFHKLLVSVFRIFYPQRPDLFINRSCHIDSGLFIQHGFSSIVVANIGKNCWINQQVTIGYKDKEGYPTLGNNVRVGAGAKILGKISIGNNVSVGANAVVVKDVPDNCVVVGIPAQIIKKDGVKVR